MPMELIAGTSREEKTRHAGCQRLGTVAFARANRRHFVTDMLLTGPLFVSHQSGEVTRGRRAMRLPVPPF